MRGPVDIRYPKRLTDQKAAKARAVDEQVAFNSSFVSERDCCYMSVKRIAFNFRDAPLNSLDTSSLGELA